MVVEYLNIAGISGHTFFFLRKQQSAAKVLEEMEMNGSKIKTGQIILSWSPGQTQSCRVVEKTQQLTEKDKETPKNLWDCCLCCHHNQNRGCQ